MKKLLFMTVIAACIAMAASAQKLDESKVPDAVKATFAKKYPGVKAKWEMENGKYEAGFKQGSAVMAATFEPNGTMTESEVDIKVSELPATVLAYVKEHYKGK